MRIQRGGATAPPIAKFDMKLEKFDTNMSLNPTRRHSALHNAANALDVTSFNG